MNEGDNGPDGERELESQSHIKKDAEHSEAQSQERAFGKFHSDLWPDRVLADDGDSFVWISGLELIDQAVRRSLRPAKGEKFPCSLALVLDHNGRIIDGGARLSDCQWLGGIQNQKVASAEIDAEVLLATNRKDRHGSDEQKNREPRSQVPLAEEVEFFGGNEIQHAHFREAEFVNKPAEGRPSEEQCGEHRGNDADGQGDGESLDRTRGLPEEDHRSDERGDVGVKNRAEGLVIRPGQGGGE